MGKKKRQYAPEFKIKAVLEILKGEKTIAQIAGELEVHPLVLSDWKKHFIACGASIFEKPKKP